MTASTLTGIFAPGSPALLESLRTLVVSPARVADPGGVVRADFTFSNVGGAPATGVRARFALPAGVTHVAGSDAIDDAPLSGGESFIAINGAAIGDLEPNASRRISVSFRVNDLIEDGTALAFQAALVSDQLAVTASNIERVIVHSTPILQNPSTLVTILAGDEPKPGDHLTIRATIVNTGPSSAHDVIAILPVPEHTTFVPRTARIGGRPVPDSEGEPFDFDSATVVTPRLAPAQSVIVEYQAEIESPLADGTRIRLNGAISSREVAEFALHSSEIVVRSPIDFNDDETGMTVFSDDSVTPGTRIALSLRAANHGSGPAQNVSALFELPPGLIYTQGSAMIDGQPIGDEAFAGGSIALGTITPGRSVEVGLSAMVGVPPEGDYPLLIVSRLRWKGGASSGSAHAERQFQRRLTVRATARFARARNFVEVDRRVAQAEEDVDFLVHLLNDGTAAERHSQLRILPGAFIGSLRIVDADGLETPYDSPLKLDRIEPHVERVITVRAKIVPPVPDRSTLTLGAVLEQQDRTIDLGVGSLVVRSRPHIGTERCGWELQTRDPLRPGQTVDVVIRFSNDGSDTLHDAYAVLDVPAELSLERAHDARREHNTLYFGDVPAKSSHEARVTLRLLRARSGEGRIHLDGTLYGRGMSAIAFKPIEIVTSSQADFEAGAQFRSTPYEVVNAGERISYDVLLRNGGDGPANELVVRAIPSNLAVYVPASTTVNGLSVTDDVGVSVLWSQRGLVLTEIDPGVHVRVHWEMIAASPLAAGTPIDARVVLNWDGDRSCALAAPTLTVHSAPTLAGGDVPFGAISIAQTLIGTEQEAQSAAWQAAPEAVQAPVEQVIAREDTLPQATDAATQTVEGQPDEAAVPAGLSEIFERAQAALPPLDATPAPQEIVEEAAVQAPAPAAHEEAVTLPVCYVDFGPEKLTRTMRMLDKAELDGMLPHLFAIRTFFPENAVNASADIEKSFRVANRTMQSTLDRLFVRLRIPRYSLTAKDLEDRDSRFALRQLVGTLLAAKPLRGGDGRAPGVVRISGPIDTASLRALQPELESAPLGSAIPWQVAASMLGTTIYLDNQQLAVMGAYRDALIDALSTLHALPLEEFHRVLRNSANRMLDDALDNVLEALRGAAHIAVD